MERRRRRRGDHTGAGVEGPFDFLIFRAAMGRNMALVGAAFLGGAACVLLLASMVGVIGMIAGELSVFHVLALLGMAGGFALLSALCLAAAEGCGVRFDAGRQGKVAKQPD